MRRNSRFFIFILVGTILATVFAFAYTRYLKPTSPETNPEIRVGEPKVTPETEFKSEEVYKNLIVVRSNKEGKNIGKIDLENKEFLPIYSDKDSKLKILALSPVPNGGDSIGAILGKSQESPEGAYLISFSTGKEKKIIDQYSNLTAPLASKDGTSILKISFSNAERDFGFNLEIENLESKEVKSLSKSSMGIVFPQYSNDGKSVYYGELGAGKFFIKKISVNGESGETLLEEEGTLFGMSVSSADEIIYIKAPQDPRAAREAEIWRLRAKGSEPERLTKNNEEESQVSLSPDGKKLAYRIKNKIYIKDLTKEETKEIGEGDELLGWVK